MNPPKKLQLNLCKMAGTLRGQAIFPCLSPEGKTTPVDHFEKIKLQSEKKRREGLKRKWLNLLERSEFFEDIKRIRAQRRKSALVRFEIETGVITAELKDKKGAHFITCRLAPIPKSDWQTAIKVIASQARLVALLLSPEATEEIENMLGGQGLNIFPKDLSEFQTYCSCTNSSTFCRHVAAFYLFLGERLPQDPFLFYRLRGRGREEFLQAVQTERAEFAPLMPPGSYEDSGWALKHNMENFWRMGIPAEAIDQAVGGGTLALNEKLLQVLSKELGREGEPLLRLYGEASSAARKLLSGE